MTGPHKPKRSHNSRTPFQHANAEVISASNISILDAAGPLPDSLLLWRYVKLSSLFLLLEGTCFFPSIATLRSSDPLEGDLRPEPVWLKRALIKLHGKEEANKLNTWLIAQERKWALNLERARNFERARNLKKLNKEDGGFNLGGG